MNDFAICKDQPFLLSRLLSEVIIKVAISHANHESCLMWQLTEKTGSFYIQVCRKKIRLCKLAKRTRPLSASGIQNVENSWEYDIGGNDACIELPTFRQGIEFSMIYNWSPYNKDAVVDLWNEKITWWLMWYFPGTSKHQNSEFDSGLSES